MVAEHIFTWMNADGYGEWDFNQCLVWWCCSWKDWFAWRCSWFLNLPIRIKQGRIGKLPLQMPFNQLWSKPVIAEIEDCFLILGPQLGHNFDAELEKKKKEAVETKLKMLQDMESPISTDDAALQVTLVRKIVDNVQITIRRVHIRYEDCSSSPGKSFCIGIQLSEISAKSPNEEWEVEFLVGKPVVHKLARLSRLGIYFTCTTARVRMIRLVSTN